MIKPLRKRHLQIWGVLIFLLPFIIIAAVAERKNLPADKIHTPESNSFLPIVIKEGNYNGNVLQLRGNKPGVIQQLVWINKRPLQTPSATIYLGNSDTATISDAEYIGRIETRGDYSFVVPAREQYQFIVYDFIHKQIIERIKL